VALHWVGLFERAVETGKMALAVSGRRPWAMAALAMTYADWGKPAEAKALYAELVARAAREYIQPSQLAIAAAAAESGRTPWTTSARRTKYATRC
jgi:hypothetical protein